MHVDHDSPEPSGPNEPSFDLASLSAGSVMFVSGLFLLLEIGGALVLSGTVMPHLLEGRISDSLVFEAAIVVIEIALLTLLLAMEHVHPAAAGLNLRTLGKGLLLAVAVWGLCQLSLAIVSLGRHGSISLYVGWIEPAAMVAPLLKRFLSDVFAEEMFWRGIFFVWLLRTLEVRRWKDPVTRMGAALLGSQILFGITRLPAQLLDPSTRAIPPGPALVVFTLTGMFYALIYLRTRNLWLVMALHALSLWPLPIFAFDVDPSKLVVLIGAVLLIPRRWGYDPAPSGRAPSVVPRSSSVESG